jgi:predicted S18 family serine protease
MSEQAGHWTGSIPITLALAERLAAVYERLQEAHDAAGNGWQMSYCDGFDDALSLFGLRLAPMIDAEGWVLERIPERTS